MSAGVEVDTIRLRGRVRDAHAMKRLGRIRAARLLEARGPVDADGFTLVAGSDVLRSGARIEVDIANQGVPEAAVEFSAPKVATGSNVVALPLDQALDVARSVYDEASELVDWETPFEQMRVNRIDVDRDFEQVDHAGPLLAALSKVRAPYSPKTRYYPDPEKGNAATLTRGPAARWLATLYDKHGEALHRHRYARPEHKAKAAADVKAAEGRLRYELRLRPDVMGKHLRLVQDLNDDDLTRLRRGYFDRVGYGLEVSGMQRAAALVMEHEEWRVDARLALIGWLAVESQGIPVEMHRHNQRRYRKRAGEVGVAAADLLDMASTSVRLDFDSARMVAA
jgi:hypothetical protein